MTTPVGEAPEGDAGGGERWVPGPALPVEPSIPNRYRGAVVQFVVLVVAAVLTLVVGRQIADNAQDPTFSGEQPTQDEDTTVPEDDAGLPGEETTLPGEDG